MVRLQSSVMSKAAHTCFVLQEIDKKISNSSYEKSQIWDFKLYKTLLGSLLKLYWHLSLWKKTNVKCSQLKQKSSKRSHLCSFIFPNRLHETFQMPSSYTAQSNHFKLLKSFFVMEKARRTGSYLLCWAALSGDSLMSEGFFYQCSQSHLQHYLLDW